MPSENIFYSLLYFIFFIFLVIFSVLINRLFLKFSKNLGARNVRNENLIRWSPQAKPSVGGITFYIIFLLSISCYNILPIPHKLFINQQLLGILLASSVGFMIGLADDAYNTIPLLKFIGQFICAGILISTGVVIEISPFQGVNYVFTTFWVIGIMNSINMLDNMDGVAAIVSTCIIISALLFIFFNEGMLHVSIIILIGVLSSIIGFLFFNWSPAEMFMGDTGSQFLGVFLAAISIIYFWNYRDINGLPIQLSQFIIPILIFIVPLVDTFTVILHRIIRKQSPFIGGKDHTTHKLAYLGFSDTMVAIIMGGVSLVSVIIIYFLNRYKEYWDLRITLICLGYFITVFVLTQYLYIKGRKKNLLKSNEDNS